MAGGAPSNQTVTQSTVPEEFRPYQNQIWNYGMNAIGDMSPEDTQSPYGDVAGMNQSQLTALGMTQGLALSGSPLQMNAQGYANEQLQGGGFNPYATEANAYMGQNPFLDKMVGDVTSNMSNAYESGTRATRDAQFARSGGYGSSAWDAQRTRDEGAFAGALGSTVNNLYGDQYNKSANLYEQGLNRATTDYRQGQQNNNALLGMVPGLQNMDWQNIEKLMGAGDREYAYSQANLDALNNNWQNYNNFGLNQTDRYGALLRNILGTSGQSTTTTSGGGGGMGGMLGGGLMGLLGGMM